MEQSEVVEEVEREGPIDSADRAGGRASAGGSSRTAAADRSGESGTRAGSSGGTIRMLSANLWNGRADPESVAALIEALEIDVAAVQEMTPEQGEALQSVLPHGELQPDRRHNGMGIVLRSPAKMSSIPMHCRDARVAHLDPADWPELSAPLEVVNIHLVAPQILLPKPSFMIRPHQVRILVRHLASRPAAARVVLGDFNATPLWPAYWRIRSHLTDAAVAVASKTGRWPRRTWGPWHKSPRLVRIDHGFVSDGLEVHAFDVVDVPGADHNAIVMEISAPSGGAERAEHRFGDSVSESAE